VNTQIPDGRYTVVYPTGDYRTLRFQTPPAGKSLAGKQIISFKQGKNYTGFAFLVNGRVHFWSRFKDQNVPDRLQKIERAVQRVLADPEQAGLAFAMKENKCYRCGRDLTVPASLHRGMGPECAGKVGGWKKADQQAVYQAHPKMEPIVVPPEQLNLAHTITMKARQQSLHPLVIDLSSQLFERSNNVLTAEASELGLKSWPDRFELRDGGASIPYYKGQVATDPEGDVLSVSYVSTTGQPPILILND
jgi:hypothetical protein